MKKVIIILFLAFLFFNDIYSHDDFDCHVEESFPCCCAIVSRFNISIILATRKNSQFSPGIYCTRLLPMVRRWM